MQNRRDMIMEENAQAVTGIAHALALPAGAVAAFVGCGGKTTIIERLAGSIPGRVLIAPTTKMYPPRAFGVDTLGKLNAATGKLEAVPKRELAAKISHYDIVLLEADGSRGLPCKGWLEDEPVVPKFCTHTVGVITIEAQGRPADAASVHRLKEFLDLTEMKECAPITMKAIQEMVLSRNGLFRNSVGKKILMVNKIENGDVKLALRFLKEIRKKRGFDRLFYGSALRDEWTEYKEEI